MNEFLGWLNGLVQSLPEETKETVAFLSNIKNLLGISSVTAIIVAICKLGKKLYKSIQGRRYDSWEKPMGFITEDVIRLKKYYIKTRLKTESIDSGEKTKSYSITEFIRRYFRTEICSCHWILGEAGMGKTTFLTKLYYEYNTKRSTFKKFDKVFYLRFGMSKKSEDGKEKRDIEVLCDYIKQVEKNKSDKPGYKSILLLDAFDEFNESHINPIAAQKKIYELTQDVFTIIFISCRTQFFDTKRNEPEFTTLKSALDYMPSKCMKHYIQPFTERDVKRYLCIVYPIWSIHFLRNLKKRSEAYRIIRNAKDVLCRPFLLRHIDDMVQEKQEKINDILDMYYIIINKWIQREIRKTFSLNVQSSKFSDIEKAWWSFLREITRKMYINYNDFFEYIIEAQDVDEFAEQYGISVKDLAKEGRSLLSRSDSLSYEKGYFWFGHQSIFELLLADCVLNGFSVFKGNNQDRRGDLSALDQYQTFITLMNNKGLLKESIKNDEAYISKDFKQIFKNFGIIINNVPVKIENILSEQPRIIVSIEHDFFEDFHYDKLHGLLSNINEFKLPGLLSLEALSGYMPRIQETYLLLQGNAGEDGLFSVNNKVYKKNNRSGLLETIVTANIYENEMPFKIVESFIIEQTKIILANPAIIEFEIVLKRRPE